MRENRDREIAGMKEEPTEVTNQTLIEIANTDMKTKTDEVLDKKTAKTDKKNAKIAKKTTNEKTDMKSNTDDEIQNTNEKTKTD